MSQPFSVLLHLEHMISCRCSLFCWLAERALLYFTHYRDHFYASKCYAEKFPFLFIPVCVCHV